METISCPYCQNSQFATVYAGLPDRMLDFGGVLVDIVRCTKCNLVFQNPRPTLSEMSKFYPEDYECYQDVTSEEGTSWLMKQAYNYGLNKRFSAVTHFIKGGSLLDIGCASGVFLHYVQRYPGWVPYGVEISPTASNHAREKFGLEVFTGTLEKAAFADQSFDAVTMWDVLEHLHDPVGSLREVFRVLKPGGILACRVPNGKSWDARLFREYWAGLEPPRHLFIFEKASLAKIVRKAGFSKFSFSTNGGSYTTFLLSLRFFLAEKLHRPELAKSDHTWMKFLYSPLFRAGTAPIFALPSILQNGPLLTMTARKLPEESLND